VYPKVDVFYQIVNKVLHLRRSITERTITVRSNQYAPERCNNARAEIVSEML